MWLIDFIIHIMKINHVEHYSFYYKYTHRYMQSIPISEGWRNIIRLL